MAVTFLLYLSLCAPLTAGAECTPRPASAQFTGEHALRDCRREAVRLHRLDEQIRGRCRKSREAALS